MCQGVDIIYISNWIYRYIYYIKREGEREILDISGENRDDDESSSQLSLKLIFNTWGKRERIIYSNEGAAMNGSRNQELNVEPKWRSEGRRKWAMKVLRGSGSPSRPLGFCCRIWRWTRWPSSQYLARRPIALGPRRFSTPSLSFLVPPPPLPSAVPASSTAVWRRLRRGTSSKKVCCTSYLPSISTTYPLFLLRAKQ